MNSKNIPWIPGIVLPIYDESKAKGMTSTIDYMYQHLFAIFKHDLFTKLKLVVKLKGSRVSNSSFQGGRGQEN